MPQSLDSVEAIQEFAPERAQALPLRRSEYQKMYSDKPYEEGADLEVYSCDAGCKNCHCATY